MTTNIPAEIEKEVQNGYQTIFHNKQTTSALTLFHLMPKYTILVYGEGEIPTKMWCLEIGDEQISHKFFKHNPPTPAEVEDAIQTVEDEVMTLSKILPEGSMLYSLDVSVQNILKQVSLIFRKPFAYRYGKGFRKIRSYYLRSSGKSGYIA